MLVVSATKEAVVAGQGRAGKRESVAVVVGFRFSAMEVVRVVKDPLAAVIIVVRVRGPKSRQKEEYRVVAIKQTGIRALVIIGHTGQSGRQGKNPESSQ